MSGDRIQGLSIGMGMDSADISRSMSEIKRSMRGLNSEAKVTSNNFKFGKKDTDSYKKAIDQLTGTTEKQRKNVEELGKRYAQTVEEQGASSKAAQNLATEYNKQADNLNRLENELGGMQNELAKLTEEQRIAESQWTKTGDAMEKHGGRLEKAGGGVQKVGGIFTAMSAAVVGGIAGLTGGLFALTNKATEAADAIAKGSERMGISTDFYQEMDFWASQNGLSQDNLEKAVGRLNQRMGMALDGNEKYSTALERLGVDLEGVRDGTISTEDAMAQSIQSLSEMENEHEKAALATEMFGTKLSRELLPALNDGSLSIEDAKDKAQELGLVMSEDQLHAAEAFQDAQDQIKRALGAVATQIGLDLMPQFQKMLDWILERMPQIRETISNVFDSVVDKVKGVVNWWNGLSDTMKKIFPVIGGLALAFGPVLLIVGKVMSAVGGLMIGLAPVMKSIATAGGLLKWLTPLFAALTSPVTLTVAAIVALGAGFVLAYKKSETFRNFIGGLGERFQIAWEKVKLFGDNVKTAFDGIFAIFKGDEEGGINLLQSLGLSEDKITLITSVIDSIKEKFTIMKDGINNALGQVKEFFINQFNSLKDWWDTDGALIFSAIQTVAENVFDSIKWAADIGLTFVQNLFEKFAPIVEGIWNLLWPTMLYLIENVWEKIKLAIGITMDLIQGIISGVSALIEGDWSRFGEILKETALSIKDRVTEFFGNLRDNALDLFNKLTGGALGKFTELKDGAVQRVTDMFNSVTGWFSDLWSNTTQKATDIKDGVVSGFNSMKDDSVARTKEMFNSVTGWFGNLWTDTTSKVTGIKDDTVGLFIDMKDGAIEGVQKLYNGASGLFDDVKDYAKDTFQNMVDGAKELPGKLGDAIKNGASKAVDGVKSLGNKMTDKLGSVVNGVIGGLNSITGKIGIDTKIGLWDVPTFSTGTGQGSPSGKLTKNGKIAMDTLATVGDKGKGNGSGTRELVHYPNGKVGLYDNDATIFAPKGTTIFSNQETEALLGQIPKFSEGTGLWASIKNIASKAVDYITNPKKIFDDLISAVGENFGDMTGFAGNFIKGAWNMIKDGMFGWIKDKFSEATVGKSQKWMDYKMTTPYSPNAPVPGYPTSFNGGRHYGIDYGTPTGVNITAPMAGTITRMNDQGGGNVARLDAAGNAAQYFMHMSSVKTGKVGIGDSVGKSGNTGKWTTGAHVHWQHEDPSASYVQNRNTKNPLSMIKGHLKGGQILSDGLFNLHKGEYVINPNEPTEAMKLLAIVGKKLAGKSKQTKELPNVPRGNDNETVEALKQIIANQQEQIKQNTELIKIALGIEDKTGITENQIGRTNDRYNDRHSSKHSVKTGRFNYNV
ncbi:peptidoglycan DD-metalloendopeptidase family protein [Jeotgalicoccus sp. WY2]|uniref:peptidoglycan DD-metalloendopeptidase family protein n=1 Tax=Jeotgalicoccus sp. WY2 TaxID=2708346 RepID=UPI001BD1F7FF|nr:peptidoglycan DD-metalloendopeptidase family protein [Jeotgalicoccus sp. WY2]